MRASQVCIHTHTHTLLHKSFVSVQVWHIPDGNIFLSKFCMCLHMLVCVCELCLCVRYRRDGHLPAVCASAGLLREARLRLSEETLHGSL